MRWDLPLIQRLGWISSSCLLENISPWWKLPRYESAQWFGGADREFPGPTQLLIRDTKSKRFWRIVAFLGFPGLVIMGNAAGSADISQNKETRSLTPTGSGRQVSGVKPPMPPEEELEERFSAALVSPEAHKLQLPERVHRRTMKLRNKECGICRTCAYP